MNFFWIKIWTSKSLFLTDLLELLTDLYLWRLPRLWSWSKIQSVLFTYSIFSHLLYFIHRKRNFVQSTRKYTCSFKIHVESLGLAIKYILPIQIAWNFCMKYFGSSDNKLKVFFPLPINFQTHKFVCLFGLFAYANHFCDERKIDACSYSSLAFWNVIVIRVINEAENENSLSI